MSKQFQISPEELDSWAKEIEGLPKAEPEKLNKRHAILRLKPSIEEMKRKGYTLAAIAKYFTEKKELPITVSALKSILSHADGGEASGRKKRRKRKEQAQGPSASANPVHAAGTEAKSQGEVSGKKEGSAAEPPKTEAKSEGEIGSKKKGESPAESAKGAAVQESKKEAKPEAKPTLGERASGANGAKPDPGGESTKEGKPAQRGSFVIRPDTKDI